MTLKLNKSNRNLLIVFLMYLYTFFIIYMPRISDLLINIEIEYFSVLILGILIVPFFAEKMLKQDLSLNKHLVYLICGIFISSVYFATRAILEFNEIRIAQNNFVIIQIIHVIIIINIFKKLGYSKDEMFTVLLNLGLFQGIITILMLVFPQLRMLALDLYYLGKPENIFISANRIYGISGDYTFFTPVYHGMLASIACVFALLKSNKYIWYVPFILLVVLLNGRTGLAVFLVSTIASFGYILIKKKHILKILQYTTILLVFSMLMLLIVRTIAPNTYEWIQGLYNDTVNLVVNEELSGNYTVLLEEMFYFPEGINMLFGEGHRVFGSDGKERNYTPSDIGFVNDMFMGGVIYIIILYGSIFKFIFKKNTSNSYTKSDILIYNVIPLILLLTLLIANFKGEAMRGGVILVGAIFIKLISMQNNKNINS